MPNPETNPARATYVLYHAGCQDGFAAAFVAHLVFGDAAAYFPVAYGTPMPAMEPGSDVFILDFSYPLPDLNRLSDRMHAVIVIDHHVTARTALAALGEVCGNVRVVFDTSRCGAALTWRHFFPGDPLPEIIRHVEDRDLWRWQVPDSKLVTAGLASYPHEFAVWASLAMDVPRLKAEGVVALRVTQQEAQRAAAQTTWQQIGGYTVPVCNATNFHPEVGDYLLNEYGDAKFVASYRDTRHGLRRWSLRSRADFDCSAIAKQLGGGGHPQACGFEERMRPGALRIARERARQLRDLSAQHDDEHDDGSLARAAACYAGTAAEQVVLSLDRLPDGHAHPDWPWGSADWQPSDDPTRNLEKAGALCAAEIDRIERQRAAHSSAEDHLISGGEHDAVKDAIAEAIGLKGGAE